jgi:two-component system chemotaxis response regulator CheY
MRTVLVVDDVPDAREVVARLLKWGGFQAVTAEDGYEALAAVNTQTPDLVLLDLTMPRMDGVAVLKALREDPRWRHLPVVLFTAVSDGRLVEEAGRLGVQDFILKGGVGGAELLDRITRHLPNE